MAPYIANESEAHIAAEKKNEMLFFDPSLFAFLSDPVTQDYSRSYEHILLTFLERWELGREQGRSQEFDLGGYKWVKETKQPHKNI